MKRLQNIKSQIISVCSKHSEIMAVYLFGSVADGTSGATSDVDIAVLLKTETRDSFRILSIISELEILLKCRVDVVVLNHADELLKYEVRKNGILIFERCAEYRIAFVVRSRKSYEDFLHLHDRYVNTVIYGEKNGC